MKIKKLLIGILAVGSLFIITSCNSISDFISGLIPDANTNVNTSQETKSETIAKDEKYKVVWKNDDGTILKELTDIDGNSIPEYDLDTPTKAEDEKYTYTFDKWIQSVNNQNKVIEFVASYNRIYKIDTEITDWGYKDLQTYDNKNNLILLYDEIDTICNNFYEAKIDAEEKTYNYSDNTTSTEYLIGGDIEYSKYNLTTAEVKMVYACVLLDHPEYYFTKGLITGSYTTKDSQTGEILTQIDYLNITCEAEYKDKTTRQTYLGNINSYKETIKELVKNITDNAKKVRAIHDYIINNAKYALDSNGNPDNSSFSHNILGIIINKKGVCESYAELFQLLLIDNDINCVRVSGIGYTNGQSEAHAWNYAEVDGDWYAFDVTWDDPIVNGGATDQLKHNYFGCGSLNTEFKNTHYPQAQGDQTYGVNYLYTLPTLNKLNLIVL